MKYYLKGHTLEFYHKNRKLQIQKYKSFINYLQNSNLQIMIFISRLVKACSVQK